MKTAIITLMLLVAVSAIAAQSQSARFEEEVGSLNVRRDHIRWPAPEAVVEELRSTSEGVRLQALYLIGLTEEQAHETIWSNQSPSAPIGKRIVAPDEVKLTYASLGNDATQYAIIGVLAGQMTFAAIVAPEGKSEWKRMATFDCWCKYELNLGQDTLSDFVGLRPALDKDSNQPAHFELVLRASGGGTGIYVQYEAHFRVRNDELHRVMSFVSRRRSCIPTEPSRCTLEARWFIPNALNGEGTAVLLESRGEYPSEQNDRWVLVRELENLHLRQTGCREYRWDARKLRYEPASSCFGLVAHGAPGS